MKKIISLLLVLCLCVGLCACSQAEKKEGKEASKSLIMPEGLEFGMSFENVRDWEKENIGITVNMDLKSGSFSGSYVAHMAYWDMSEFYELDADYDECVKDPHAMFSFNSDNEMYEFYGGGTVAIERDAEAVQEHIVAYYEEVMDKKAIWTEDGSDLIARLGGKNEKVEVLMYPSNGEYEILVVIHNYEYEVK